MTDNYKGYEESDLSKYVDNLRERQFLLVHGTADDNVHVQQSMVLARALTSKGVLYKQQIYPDEGHSLSGVKRHLYRSMTAFFEDCFKKLVSLPLRSWQSNTFGSVLPTYIYTIHIYILPLSYHNSLFLLLSTTSTTIITNHLQNSPHHFISHDRLSSIYLYRA